MPPELLIGVASEVITPELGCEMAGFDARKGHALSVHDDLHVRALVLDDGRNKVALVSVELLGVDGPFATHVRCEIERQTAIPAGNVILAATHTHCGPATFNHFYNQGQPLDQTYLSRLATAIVSSVEAALAHARPCTLRSGFVRADGIAVNRRTADGLPVDPRAGVLFVQDFNGNPVALAVNFACHTTVLGPNTLEISGDFPFYTIRQLQEELGAGVEVLFFNGSEGDISIGHKSDLSAVGVIAPFRTFKKAEELGRRLAVAVINGLSSLEPEEPTLGIERRTLQLPLKKYAPLPIMKDRREGDLAEVQRLAADDSPELLKARQRSLFSRIEEYYALLYESAGGAEPKTLAAELTAMRVGNTVLLSFPGEVFVGTALDIRRRSKFKRTMFLGLANDYIGYLPTAEADAAAGYEVVAARVTPQAAAILTDCALELLNSFAPLALAGQRGLLDRKLRIGVVGLGMMGEQYVRIYQSHPLAEVTAVASRSLEKASIVASKYEVKHACRNWQELIDLPQVDAVCVATPDGFHYEPARAAIQAGKHVLIEKPMTTDLAEADSLVQIARTASVKVQVAFNHRWLAPYYQGYSAIQSGAIGQPLSAYARKNDTIYVPTEYINWASQTTPAWFLSCHDIDLVRWYLNSEPWKRGLGELSRCLRAEASTPMTRFKLRYVLPTAPLRHSSRVGSIPTHFLRWSNRLSKS